LECYNPVTNKWHIADPFNEVIIDSRLTIARFVESSKTLMMFAAGTYKYKPIMAQDNLIKQKYMTYMVDVILNYVTYHKKLLMIKNSFYLEDRLRQDASFAAPFFHNL
jgi:hypothetical protein